MTVNFDCSSKYWERQCFQEDKQFLEGTKFIAAEKWQNFYIDVS